MILSDFHSVSVPATSQSIVVADMVADMAAKMDLHMVADMEVNKVADKIADMAKKGTQFGERDNGHAKRRRTKVT